MENKTYAPGELRRKYNEVLLEIKSELQRILRDYGKCLSFKVGQGKKTWIKFTIGSYNYALVYSSGDIIKVELIGEGENERPNIRPGKDLSVFDPSSNISIYDLLEFIDLYPQNPFGD